MSDNLITMAPRSIIDDVLDCLLEMRMIVNGYYIIQQDNCYMVSNIPQIGHISRICIVMCDSLETVIDDTHIEDQCTIYVLPTLLHIEEVLTLNNKSTMILMKRNIILAHMTGIISNIMRHCRYGVCHVPKLNFNRRMLLDICTNKSQTYDTMLSASSNNSCETELKNVYYHKCNNVLDTFGVDYIFCIYRSYKLYGFDPLDTVYILREGDSANVVLIT